MTRERLVALTPLPAGWRRVDVLSPGPVLDLRELPDDELFRVTDVVALAQVQVWENAPDYCDDDLEPSAWSLVDVVRPVSPVAVEDGGFAWCDAAVLLEPGADVGPWVRDAAIATIEENEREELAWLMGGRPSTD